ALEPLRRAATLARAADEPALETMMLTLLGTVAFALQDAETGATVSGRASELAADGQRGAATLMDLAQAISLLRTGEADRALAVVQAVDPYDAGPLDGLRAFLVARSLCELGRAQDCLDLLSGTTAPMAPYGFGVDVLQARCQWMLGRLDGADALLAHRSVMAAADGRADDAAALHALRRLIATVNGSAGDLDPVNENASPLALLFDGLASAIAQLPERPEVLADVFAFAMALGGPGAAIAEVRHLLTTLPLEFATNDLHGSAGAARRVADALTGGNAPAATDVMVAVPLLPRPVLARATVAWCVTAVTDERPPWASALTAGDRAVLHRAFTDAGCVEPLWAQGTGHMVELAVVGPVEVRVDGKAVTEDLHRERVRALLWLVVLRRRITRGEAAELLWPDLSEAAAANNLRTTLSYAARLLSDPTGAAVLAVDRNALALIDDGRLRVDAWRLEHELDRGRRAERAGGIAEALAAYRRAAACWRSDPIHEVASAPWLEVRLGELRADFVEAATRAAELLVGRDDEAALGLATRALAADRWSLRASEVAIRAQAGMGRDAAARQALLRHRSLVAELGLDDAHLAPLATAVAHASLGRITRA
ncbi:MAG: BTAD domain-containing putative transcriptional regulator, partial [Aquihabitans sp.]